MGLTEQDVRRIIRDEITKAFGIDFISSDIEFAQTKKAAELLGYPNPRGLYRLIDDGVLRIGLEVQDRRGKDKAYADYWFNIPACKKRLNTPPEKRA